MPDARTLGGDLEGALERVNVPSFVLDDTGVVPWVNRAGRRLVGEVRGRHFTSVAAREEKLNSQGRFAQNVLGVRAVRAAEIVLLDAHHERVAVELTSVPLRRGGRVIGVFGQAKEAPKRASAPPLPGLTPRQAEVLGLLELGRSTRQIAEDLHLSRETVRNHVRHLL